MEWWPDFKDLGKAAMARGAWWTAAGLVFLAFLEELFLHRLLSWVNEKLDQGVTPALSVLGVALSWVTENRVLFIVLLAVSYCIVVVAIAQVRTSRKPSSPPQESMGGSHDTEGHSLSEAKTSDQHPPILRYDGVFGEPWFLITGLGITVNPQLMYVSNTQVDVPITANNVRVRIEYTHADKERFVIREALWLETPGTAEFVDRVQIGSGKTARLCLLMEQRQGPFIVIEDTSNKSGIKALRPGKWRLRLFFSMDHRDTYQASGVIYISEDNRIRYETPLAFSFWKVQGTDQQSIEEFPVTPMGTGGNPVTTGVEAPPLAADVGSLPSAPVNEYLDAGRESALALLTESECRVDWSDVSSPSLLRFYVWNGTPSSKPCSVRLTDIRRWSDGQGAFIEAHAGFAPYNFKVLEEMVAPELRRARSLVEARGKGFVILAVERDRTHYGSELGRWKMDLTISLGDRQRNQSLEFDWTPTGLVAPQKPPEPVVPLTADTNPDLVVLTAPLPARIELWIEKKDKRWIGKVRNKEAKRIGPCQLRITDAQSFDAELRTFREHCGFRLDLANCREIPPGDFGNDFIFARIEGQDLEIGDRTGTRLQWPRADTNPMQPWNLSLELSGWLPAYSVGTKWVFDLSMIWDPGSMSLTFKDYSPGLVH